MAGNALYDVGMRLRAAELHDGGHRPRGDRCPSRDAGGNRERMAVHLQVCWYRGSGHDGKETHRLFVRDEAGRRQGGRRRGHDEARGHGEVRDSLAKPFQEMAEGLQGGGPGGAQAKAQGEAEGVRLPSGETTREQELERRIKRLEAENAYLKKSIALKAEKRSRTARRPRS